MHRNESVRKLADFRNFRMSDLGDVQPLGFTIRSGRNIHKADIGKLKRNGRKSTTWLHKTP